MHWNERRRIFTYQRDWYNVSSVNSIESLLHNAHLLLSLYALFIVDFDCLFFTSWIQIKSKSKVKTRMHIPAKNSSSNNHHANMNSINTLKPSHVFYHIYMLAHTNRQSWIYFTISIRFSMFTLNINRLPHVKYI